MTRSASTKSQAANTTGTDQATKAPAAALTPSPVNAATVGVLVLFPFTPEVAEAGKTYPIMRGHIDTRAYKIPVSAFKHKTEEGREVLQLSIGGQGQEHIGGALFRSEVLNETNGKWESLPGKERDRFGTISKSVKTGEDAQGPIYETVFELRVNGSRRVSDAGVHYIRAKITPVRGAVAENQDDNNCF